MTKRQKNLLAFAQSMRECGVRRVEFDGVTIELDPPKETPPPHIIDDLQISEERKREMEEINFDRLQFHSA